MADPVADKSGFLRTYMSNHPDTLVAYAKFQGKVKEEVTHAQMTAINSKVCALGTFITERLESCTKNNQSMTLKCKLNSGAETTVTIPFNPPLSGYDDVKPRLLAMRAEAQQALGMVSDHHSWPAVHCPHAFDFSF